MPQSQQNQPVSPRTCWQMRLANLPNMCGSCIFTTCFQKHIDQFMYIYIDFMITSASHLVLSRQKKSLLKPEASSLYKQSFPGVFWIPDIKNPGNHKLCWPDDLHPPPIQSITLIWANYYTLPETKSSHPARRLGPKTRWIIFQPYIFQVRSVSFREGNFLNLNCFGHFGEDSLLWPPMRSIS